MRRKKKTLLTVMCAALLVVASIAGTMAYLTDTEQATNTFTVGKVYIDLDEKNVDGDKDSEGDTPERDKQNDYHLLPGHTYEKDPTVTVKAGSEKSYVRMLVEVQNINKLKDTFTDKEYYGKDGVFLLQNLVEGWDPGTWVYKSYTESTNATTNVKSGVYEFRYKGAVAEATNDFKLDALFDKITIPGEGVTNDNIGNLADVKILVTAHAIQADGFDTDDAAWAAFDGQMETAN